MNDLEYVDQDQKWLCTTHFLMLLEKIYPDLYVLETWHDEIYHILAGFSKVTTEWPWRYRLRSKVIVHDTSSQASDNLCHSIMYIHYLLSHSNFVIKIKLQPNKSHTCLVHIISEFGDPI